MHRIVLVGLLLGACGDDGGAAIEHGALAQACYPNGTCNVGLACAEGVCVEPSGLCGNGIVDTSVLELCDLAITSGDGMCPASCDDADACTTDALVGASCDTSCEHTAITAIAAGDGCCPPGANATTDADCSASCGNAVKEAGETCDTGIASGAYACPASCADDGDGCTSDALVAPGTCQAACPFTPITAAVDGDGCCPSTANANTDDDCTPACGNGVTESPETCDDNNTMNGDGCTSSCAFAPSRLDISVEPTSLTTELATTTTLTITLTATDNFEGPVTLTATALDPSSIPLTGWSIAFATNPVDVAKNGTATTTATLTLPTENHGLAGDLTFSAASTAMTGDWNAITGVTVVDQITIPMTVENGHCVYPPAGTMNVTIGSTIRWRNDSQTEISIHTEANSNACFHQGTPSPPDTSYACTLAGTPGASFAWSCHTPLDAITPTDRRIQPVAP